MADSGMHLLYVDDSGSVGNASEKHFVLSGVAVFERAVYHVIKALDDLVAEAGVGPDPHEIELHASHIYGGRGMPWREIPRRDREALITNGLAAMRRSARSVRLFGVAVEKARIAPRDPVEYAFEEICNRFNLYLQRVYHRSGHDPAFQHKGLVIMDESNYEQPLQALARRFRVQGTQWGNLRNMAEVPLFVDSRASRIVQLADLVAFGIWRKYEHQDGRFFDPIMDMFDAEGGTIHGLVHFHDTTEQCYCPACMSRGAANRRRTPMRSVKTPLRG